LHIHVLSDDDPKGLVAPKGGYRFIELFEAEKSDHGSAFDTRQVINDLKHQHRLQNNAAKFFGTSLDLDESKDCPSFEPYRHFNSDLIAYQKSILKTGYIFYRCPICGKYLKSDKSYPVYNYWDSHYLVSFVEFNCDDICFYLMLGASPCRILGFYIPSTETIVSLIPVGTPTFEDNRRYWNHKTFRVWVNDFKRYCIYNWAIVKEKDRLPGKKKIAITLGFLHVFGHVLHDELAAVEYVLENFEPDPLPLFIIGNKDRFDLERLFPELNVQQRFQSESPQRACMDLFKHSLERNLFCFRISHVGRVQESLSKKIFSNVKGMCQGHFFNRVDESRRTFPLVWVTLRTGNRTWIGMIDNICRLIRRMTDHYPCAGFVLDGLPVESANVETIKSRLPGHKRIFNGTRCSFPETIFWIHFVDFTIQARGNATAFAVIANKTGVCIGAETLLPPKTTFNNRADFLGCYSGRENGLKISLLPCETDQSADIRNYDNLILDWQDVADAALYHADAFEIAKTSANKLNFSNDTTGDDWLDIDTRSCRYLEPISSDGIDGRYKVTVPLPTGTGLDSGFALPWPDNYAGGIKGGRVSIGFASLQRLVSEWHRVLKADCCLEFEYPDLHCLHRLLSQPGDGDTQRSFLETYLPSGSFYPITTQMITECLTRMGYLIVNHEPVKDGSFYNNIIARKKTVLV